LRCCDGVWGVMSEFSSRRRYDMLFAWMFVL
jgi:hypothetical protein